MHTFQSYMANVLNGNTPVYDKIVLEIGADPWFLSSKEFIRLGARTVISSDIVDHWDGDEPNIAKVLVDARHICNTIPKSSVDIVYGINILEHLPDIDLVLQSVYDVLKPGGYAFLHGHPIWTSSQGHHAILGSPENWLLHFSENNCIPLWGHLYMTESELRHCLVKQPSNVIESAVDWCFKSNHVTRKSRLEILNTINSSPMTVVSYWESSLHEPTAEHLNLIRKGPYWNPSENYAIRDMNFFLVKS